MEEQSLIKVRKYCKRETNRMIQEMNRFQKRWSQTPHQNPLLTVL